MAPTVLRSRATKPTPSIRAGRTTAPSVLKKPQPALSDDITTTKRDKRQMKHSILISRLKAAHPSTNKVQKKRQKARESKSRREKLSVKLQDLGDALPSSESTAGTGKSASSSKKGVAGAELLTQSLRHTAGHSKRLKKLKDVERLRFARNLGAMSAGGTHQKEADGPRATKEGEQPPVAQDTQAAKWAALRQHILSQQQSV